MVKAKIEEAFPSLWFQPICKNIWASQIESFPLVGMGENKQCLKPQPNFIWKYAVCNKQYSNIYVLEPPEMCSLDVQTPVSFSQTHKPPKHPTRTK